MASDIVHSAYRLTTLYLMLLNKKHAALREQLGKSATVVDRSMMNVQGEESNDGTGERAFDDETDLKNEDFIFLY
jgi:hypothetical protein